MDKSICNIVFDVGMVLIDFCWDKHCRNLGFSEKIIQAFDANMIHSEIWTKLDEGTIETADAIQEFVRRMPQYEAEVNRFWESPECFVEEYEYAAPLIRTLKEQGYHVYLLSNYPYDMYKVHWPAFSFYSLVDGYVVSAVEKLIKPDQAIFRLLCERYQLKPQECLFLDDRRENVEAAICAGMQGVTFTGYQTLKNLFGL